MTDKNKLFDSIVEEDSKYYSPRANYNPLHYDINEKISSIREINREIKSKYDVIRQQSPTNHSIYMNENEMKVYNELKEQIKRDSLRNHPIETLNQITPFYEQNIQQKDNSIVHNSQIQNLSAVTFEVNNSKLSKEKISQLMASKEKSKENVENLYEKEPLRKGPSQFEESFTRDIFSSPKYEEMAKNSTTAELNSKINERIENLKEN